MGVQSPRRSFIPHILTPPFNDVNVQYGDFAAQVRCGAQEPAKEAIGDDQAAGEVVKQDRGSTHKLRFWTPKWRPFFGSILRLLFTQLVDPPSILLHNFYVLHACRLIVAYGFFSGLLCSTVHLRGTRQANDGGLV
eukprot:s3212_g18.t1